MSVEKKTIRPDIPGNHSYMGGSTGYAGTPISDYRRMVISREISLKGSISSCDYLVVEGEIEAASFTARRLDVMDSGLFSGIAEVHDCVIAGEFDGKLTVTGRLTVKSTAQMSGTIEYSALEVEAGAKINAQLTPLEAEEEEASTPPSTVLEVEPFNDNQETQPQITERGTTVFRRAAGN